MNGNDSRGGKGLTKVLMLALTGVLMYNIGMYKGVKRGFDILFSIIGIIFLVPVSIIVKIAYLCTGDIHSIFYSQMRIGKNGKQFKMYKFRTMEMGAEEKLEGLLDSSPEMKKEYAENHKINKDPRITPAGYPVRRTSLDEMPQFINVLFGQMSVVGNRPYLPREKKEIGDYFDAVTAVKPGITGYWQISGRNNLPFKKRLKLEKYYSEHMNFGLDCKILFKTLSAIIVGRGAK